MAQDNSQQTTDDDSQRRPGRVYPQQHSFRHRRTNDYCLSDSAILVMATWNCGGLTKVKKDMIMDFKYDIVCLTETHVWRDQDPSVFYSVLSLMMNILEQRLLSANGSQNTSLRQAALALE